MNKVKCEHKECPSVVLGVEILELGFIKYKLKCLNCGEEFYQVRQARRGGEFGLVGKTLVDFPYIAPCDWNYEDIKEAYDIMIKQCKGRHVYGQYYLGRLLKKSFGSDLDRL